VQVSPEYRRTVSHYILSPGACSPAKNGEAITRPGATISTSTNGYANPSGALTFVASSIAV